MANHTAITAAHVRYLLAIKRIYREKGILSSEIARELKLSKPTVHNMMDVFLEKNYICKKPQGLVYLTDNGMRTASVYETYYYRLRELLFADSECDKTAETAICALIGELSEENLAVMGKRLDINTYL